MYQYSHVVPVYLEDFADLGLVLLFQENGAENLAILLRKILENRSHQLLALARDYRSVGGRAPVHEIVRLLGNRRMPRGSAQVLHHDIDRNRMHIGTEPLRMVQAPVRADEVEHAQ